MRHKYRTRALVLARTPLGEANALLALLTEEVGLVRARAQGVRKSGAKLASALATFSECDATLVKGGEGWRIAGAVPLESHFRKLPGAAREAGSRVAGLALRLMPGESENRAAFALVAEYFHALADLSPESYESAEHLAVLRLLASLGLDAGEFPPESFAPEVLAFARANRRALVARINRGLEASGL